MTRDAVMIHLKIFCVLILAVFVGQGCGTDDSGSTSSPALPHLDKTKFEKYRDIIPEDFDLNIQHWGDKKKELASLRPSEIKALLVYALMHCNENNENLQEDYFKIVSVQRLFLADLALEADWPEMAWNLETEACVGAKIANSGYSDEFESDAKTLQDHRVDLILYEQSQNDMNATYYRHQTLFDETANTIAALPKFVIWKPEMFSEPAIPSTGVR